MRWVIRIEREEDDGEINTGSDAICIERSRLERAADLGPTLVVSRRLP